MVLVSASKWVYFSDKHIQVRQYCKVPVGSREGLGHDWRQLPLTFCVNNILRLWTGSRYYMFVLHFTLLEHYFKSNLFLDSLQVNENIPI